MRPNPSSLVERFLSLHNPDPKLGQHFLTEISDVAAVLEPIGDRTGHLLEIGGGPGGLTTVALNKGFQVTVIEKDPRAVQHLERQLKDDITHGSLRVILGDAMRLSSENDFFWVIGNIDYAITSPLLARLDEIYGLGGNLRPSISLLIQYEVAERLAPSAVGRARSSLGMVLGLGWEIELGRVIHAAKFRPRPAVDGRILILRPIVPKRDMGDLRLARRLIRAGYAHRRRKLSNVFERVPNKIDRLSGWDRERWGMAMEVLLNDQDHTILERRAEELEVDDWIELAERFNALVLEEIGD